MFDDIIKENIELSREQEVLLYVINILNGLIDIGIMENKVFEISDEGLELIKNIKGPNDEEIKNAMMILKCKGYI